MWPCDGRGVSRSRSRGGCAALPPPPPPPQPPSSELPPPSRRHHALFASRTLPSLHPRRPARVPSIHCIPSPHPPLGLPRAVSGRRVWVGQGGGGGGWWGAGKTLWRPMHHSSCLHCHPKPARPPTTPRHPPNKLTLTAEPAPPTRPTGAHPSRPRAVPAATPTSRHDCWPVSGREDVAGRRQRQLLVVLARRFTWSEPIRHPSTALQAIAAGSRARRGRPRCRSSSTWGWASGTCWTSAR